MSREILIIRLSAMGDVIHTLPVAAAIKDLLPDCRITWVCEPAVAALLINNPAIDKVLVFPGRHQLARMPFLQSVLALRAFFKELRSSSYDVAIDAQGLLKSALIALFSGAKVRIGFARTREFADRFLTNPVHVGDYFGNEMHVVELNLELVTALQKVMNLLVANLKLEARFPLPELPFQTIARIETYLKESNFSGKHSGLLPRARDPYIDMLPSQMVEEPQTVMPSQAVEEPQVVTGYMPSDSFPLAILIPGTTWASKVWPEYYWGSLATLLISQLGLTVWLIGGPSEIESGATILQAISPEWQGKCLNLIGKTNLLDLIGIYRVSRVVVGADTGPLHLAAATGHTKVVGIYGSTPTIRNGPYGKNCDVVSANLSCQPCFAKVCPLGTTACLNELEPSFVYEKIRTFLVSA